MLAPSLPFAAWRGHFVVDRSLLTRASFARRLTNGRQSGHDTIPFELAVVNGSECGEAPKLAMRVRDGVSAARARGLTGHWLAQSPRVGRCALPETVAVLAADRVCHEPRLRRSRASAVPRNAQLNRRPDPTIRRLFHHREIQLALSGSNLLAVRTQRVLWEASLGGKLLNPRSLLMEGASLFFE